MAAKKGKVEKEGGRLVVATHRQARHDYHIDDTFEAGIVLTGTEVKSLRRGLANMRDSYALVRDGEVWLYNLHISPYPFGNRFNHEPTRTRKLLLHRHEIRRLTGKLKESGVTLVPLRIYFNERGIAKVEMALARGKKKWDKREALARRDEQRQIERALKERQRS